MRSTTTNIGFAKWRVQCFYDSLVQGSSSVFQMNICAENPPLRKAEKRCLQYVDGIPTYRISLKLNLYEILKLNCLNLGKLNIENSKSWTEIMQSLTARNLNIII